MVTEGLEETKDLDLSEPDSKEEEEEKSTRDNRKRGHTDTHTTKEKNPRLEVEIDPLVMEVVTGGNHAHQYDACRNEDHVRELLESGDGEPRDTEGNIAYEPDPADMEDDMQACTG